MPQAITAFLESTDFEDALRKAVSLSGDSATQVCIAGGIAQAFYGGLSERIARRVCEILDALLGTGVIPKSAARFNDGRFWVTTEAKLRPLARFGCSMVSRLISAFRAVRQPAEGGAPTNRDLKDC